MRRRSPMDPVVERELEELDAVLAGEREDPEIALIAAEVRESGAPMPPGLAERIETAVAEGVAPRRTGRRARGLSLGRLAPAVGLAGAAAVAIAVGLSSTGDRPSELAAPETAVVERDATAGGAAQESAPGAAAPQDAAVAPSPGGRRVQRAADLVIATPTDRLERTSDDVTRTVDRLGGYVHRSDVTAAGGGGQATFDLRIPTSRLDEALAALSRLGHVRSRTQQSQDITRRFTSARQRLTDARAERRALLRALAAATTPQEIESVRARLAIARSRIAAAKGDLFAARRAATMARVGVTVLSSGRGAVVPGGEPFTPRRALEDALALLSTAAGVAIVAAAAAVPAGLLALLLVLGWRALRRQRREAALRQRPSVV